MSKVLFSVDECLERTGIGRTTFFALLNSGTLTSIKIGTRTFVRPDDLIAFVANCEVRNVA